MDIYSAILLSLKISFVAVLLQSIPAIFIGYYLATRQGKLALFINILSMLPLVLTPLVVGYFVIQVFHPNRAIGILLEKLGIDILFNWKGAVLGVFLVSIPLYIQTVQIAFLSVPQNLRKHSLLLGNTPLKTFFQVDIPLCKLGILRGALLSFTRGLGEFGASIMIMGIIPNETETIPTSIFRHFSIPGNEEKVHLLVFISFLISCFFLILIQWLQIKKN